MEIRVYRFIPRLFVLSPTRLEGMEICSISELVEEMVKSPTRLEGMEIATETVEDVVNASLRPALRGWKFLLIAALKGKGEGLRPALRGWKYQHSPSPQPLYCMVSDPP